MSPKSTLYEQDFYAWSLQQATLLRAGDVEKADLEKIAEEIESIGRTERRELISRLTVLLVHLLQWRHQPALRGRSWRLSIEGRRLDIADHLADNPSLKAELPAAVAQAYRRALIEASRETGLRNREFSAGMSVLVRGDDESRVLVGAVTGAFIAAPFQTS